MGLGIFGMSQNAFREGNTFYADIAHLAVTGNGVTINIAATVHVARGQETLDIRIFGMFHIAHLGEEAEGHRLFGLASMLERPVVRPAVRLIHQRLAHYTRYINKEKHGRNRV